MSSRRGGFQGRVFKVLWASYLPGNCHQNIELLHLRVQVAFVFSPGWFSHVYNALPDLVTDQEVGSLTVPYKGKEVGPNEIGMECRGAKLSWNTTR